MGRLSPADVARIEEHLLVCNRCRNKLVEVEETMYLIREHYGSPKRHDHVDSPISLL